MVFLSLLVFFVKTAGCSSEFHVVFKHFENPENLLLNILKEKLHISYLEGFLFLKNM